MPVTRKEKPKIKVEVFHRAKVTKAISFAEISAMKKKRTTVAWRKNVAEEFEEVVPPFSRILFRTGGIPICADDRRMTEHSNAISGLP